VTALTQKEREIIILKRQGLTVQQIARRISTSTRYTHIIINRLYQKTGTTNSPSLVAWGFEHGILKINAENLSDKVDRTG